jgi:RNA polymerase sigma-70 factor (ECF subfamily)
MSDQALAEQAAGGCRASFAALCEAYYDRIYRLAWRLSGSRAEAEDIAQEVCVKLATAIRDFRGDAAFATWLWRITFTTATDRQRAGRKVTAFDPALMTALVDASQAPSPSPEDQVIGAELWQAVRALPDQQRDAILLVYGEGMNHAEAAGVMGCREKTVSWHLHEAKKRLRIQLQAAI